MNRLQKRARARNGCLTEGIAVCKKKHDEGSFDATQAAQCIRGMYEGCKSSGPSSGFGVSHAPRHTRFTTRRQKRLPFASRTSLTPRGCPPPPPGCKTVTKAPECRIHCSPVPEAPVRNPSALGWAGIAAGAAALAGGGYYLYKRRQHSQLEAETGVSVNGDCTLFTVTDAEVAVPYLQDFADTAMVALEDTPVSTLVFGASYLDSVAPQCGVVSEGGIQVDTWQKAAMVGGVALLIAGHLHESGQIEDDLFKLELDEIQAFWLEHGVDDPALVEEVFSMPPIDSDGTSGPGGAPSRGPSDLGTYQELLGGRVQNLGGLGWGLLGGLLGLALGLISGGIGGVAVAVPRLVPRLVHRSVDYGHRFDSPEGLYERLVVHLPATPEGIDPYVAVVRLWHGEPTLDEAGFPTDGPYSRKLFDEFFTEEDALVAVMQYPQVDYQANPSRAPNLGILGWGLLGAGAAALGSGAYLWQRNKKLTEACLGATDWFTPEGELTPEVVDALLEAMGQAVEEGKQDPAEVADAAVVKVSGNSECRLPRLIWGDLLRVRQLATVVAADALKTPELPPIPEGPSPEESGMEVDASCSTIIYDDAVADTYLDAWLVEQGVVSGMAWVPSPLILGAQFLEHVAPHCGVYMGASAEILGVDTPQKAVMVAVFATYIRFRHRNLGIIDQDQFAAFGDEIEQWAAQYGVDDLMQMADQVFLQPGDPGFVPGPPGDTGFVGRPAPMVDDWNEPFGNPMVENGSVGGGQGLWRVYKDETGEFSGAYYFKVWRKGQYYRQGAYQTEDDAKAAALQWIASQPKQADIGQNPSRPPTAATRMLGLLTGVPMATGLSNLARRRLRNAARLIPVQSSRARLSRRARARLGGSTTPFKPCEPKPCAKDKTWDYVNCKCIPKKITLPPDTGDPLPPGSPRPKPWLVR